MPKKLLLIGRTGVVLENARKYVEDPDTELYSATDIDDVRSVFAQSNIDHVFMGAGIELEQRLDIVREVFTTSQTTSIHLKDATSGPQGFLTFVRSVLVGFSRES